MNPRLSPLLTVWALFGLVLTAVAAPLPPNYQRAAASHQSRRNSIAAPKPITAHKRPGAHLSLPAQGAAKRARRASNRPGASGAPSPRAGHGRLSPLLVVIDMQPEFPSSHDQRTINGVKSEVLGAMKRNEPVVLVNYPSGKSLPPVRPGDDRTAPWLMDLTQSYAKRHLLPKKTSDGSKEIAEFLRQQGIDRPHLRVCGVQSSWCVKLTVRGLSRRLHKGPDSQFRIDVLGHATNADVGNEAGLRSIWLEHNPGVFVPFPDKDGKASETR